MAYWLDLVGSYIIGAMVMALVAMLNVFIGTSSNRVTFSNIEQGNLSATTDVINYDFYKIGYRVSGDAIVQADSNNIKFCSDLNNTGTVDTINYYTGDASQLASTKNPNDRLFYRVLNNETPLPSTKVTNFKLTYFDSIGTKIPYTDLSTQLNRNRIKCIEVYLKVESQEDVEGVYQGTEWQKKITPKNL